MAGGWGSSKNGVKLGVFWDSISLNADGSQARINNADIKIDRDVNISDSTNKLTWSGGAVTDGSDSNINVGGSGTKTIKNCTGQWHDLEYGSTSTASFSASMSGVDYAGGTISESRTVTYPARAYESPIAPTNLNWVQNSLGNFTLSWTNLHSASAPWTTVVLVRTEVGGTTTEIAIASPTTATSIAQTGLALDKRYTWYLRITNPTATVTSTVTGMTPIPLHTMTLSASSIAIGGTLTLTIEKFGSSNTSTINIINADAPYTYYDTVSGVTGTSVVIPIDAATYNAPLANATSRTFFAQIITYSGATQLGYYNYTFTITVPNAAPYIPTVTAPTRSEQVTTVGTAFGVNVFVKSKSRIRYTWSGAAGSGASITKREIGITRSWQAGTTMVDVTNVSGYLYEEVPTGSGTVTVFSRTTDSRGRVSADASSVVTFPVYNYADPVITTFAVARCDAAGNLNNSGTYVKFTINVAATSVNPGTEANQMKYRIRLLDASGNETGSDLYAKVLNNTLTSAITTGALGAGAYSAQSGYSFRLTLDDDLTIATATPLTKAASISSEVYPLTIGTNGIAIGKVYNDATKALDIVGHTLLTGNLTLTGTLNNLTVAELETLNGVTSNIQTQLNNKQASGSYQPAGSYAAAVHTHDDRYFTEAEVTTLLAGKRSTTNYRAKMFKSGSVSYSAATWTKITAWGTTYNENMTGMDTTNGHYNIDVSGNYDILFQTRWQNYGTVNSRSAAIVLGGSAPATDASNVLAIITFSETDWLISQCMSLDTPLLDTDYVSFWVRSAAASTLNQANTAIPGWTTATISKR